MKLGDVGNPDAAKYGKPLEGVRVLAAEQMQALPFGTQLLARLGADVVKVEHPVEGESGRGALPAMDDPQGRRVGATYLRNNLNKRSVGIDLKAPKGRELFLALVPHFDVVAENFRAGTMKKLHSATSRARCSRRSASSPRSATVIEPARDSTSTCRCSTRWSR